ncbi:FecR domain-containing protein [Rhodocytophaga aerolata]|uniref:FecR domain-containing protein n=1 Tax=Rhodocytophaga aerolata TaxID=455078 RepID=A0ABT8RDT6_9BACT|nr:FecR domain-containing protein [Rhodocytophaga aerolata]MDO1450271.1 FecR domain-containing protein [Rhodocytophaga aerolata]
MVNQELIQKFFQNRCNTQEAEAVIAYFKQHPEQLEAWLPEAEWDNLPIQEKWDASLSERMLQNIRQQTYKKPGGKQLNFIVLTAVAASLLLCLLALGIFYTTKTHGRQEPLAATTTSSFVSGEIITQVNTTDTIQQISLEDGSLVKLHPGSSLRYPKVFKISRHIQLSGEAFFSVTKDTAHPFTVVAGGLATTALGTSFTIQAIPQEKKVKIRLHTGRVVIIAYAQELKNALTEVYLRPGQELILDVAQGQTRITAIPIAKANKLTGSVQVNGNVVKFNQLPLPEVFSELTKLYGVAILYDKAAISAIQFTGSIHTNRSLERALKTIASVNDLKVVKKKEGYSIQKPSY